MNGEPYELCIESIVEFLQAFHLMETRNAETLDYESAFIRYELKRSRPHIFKVLKDTCKPRLEHQGLSNVPYVLA